MIHDIKQKNMKWWLGIVSCLVLFGVIGTFAYLKMDFIIRGVQIQASITQTKDSPLVTIKGNAKNAVYLTLNGREIFIDRDGSFSETLALLPGFGVVTIDAEDKTGRATEKKFELIYTESNGAFAYNETKMENN